MKIQGSIISFQYPNSAMLSETSHILLAIINIRVEIFAIIEICSRSKTDYINLITNSRINKNGGGFISVIDENNT